MADEETPPPPAAPESQPAPAAEAPLEDPLAQVLNAVNAGGDAAAAAVATEAPPIDAAGFGADGIDQAAIDELLKQANFDDAATATAAVDPAADATDFKLPDFQQVMRDAQASSIDLLRDVDLNVKIELGRSRMLVEDVLKLAEGSVVELDKLAGDPVDVFVNERLVARGEVLVLNDNFCVRINEIIAGVREEGL